MRRSTMAPWGAMLLCGCVCGGLLRAQGATQTPPQTPATAQTPPAQTAPAAESRPRPSSLKSKHFFFGIRGRIFPLVDYSAMQNRTALTTTAAKGEPVRDWSFVTASHSAHWSAGPAIEIVPSQKWAISVEGLYHRLSYTKVTTIAWGTDDPTTTTDERSHMFRNEDTRAALWDFPVMVHYRGLGSSGLLSRMYVAAGAAGRLATNISTSILTTYPDTSTGTSRTSAQPSKRSLLGGVVGIGFRIVDDFNINWTPEIRYTRWAGSTFSADSTLSPRNQLEVSLGFTF